MKRRVLTLFALSMLAAAPSAWAVGKGTSMFALQLHHGVGDFIAPIAITGDSGFVSAYDHSEIGVQAQYWYMMAEDYAVAVSAGVGFFNETDKPGDFATAGEGDFQYSQSSFFVRVGGDRVVKFGERAIAFFGPGIEYWNGKSKWEDKTPPGASAESEPTSRISIGARMGGIMLIGPGWGLAGSIGHKIGYASAEESGAKATWWPSSLDANGGVVFMLGAP